MRTFTALVNPVSGGGHALERWAPVSAALSAAGAHVRTERTRSAEHAVDLATEAATGGDVVVAVGGDGLVRDVAHGVVLADGTLGIVPAGRGNDYAAKLRLPSDAKALAALLLDAQPRAVDVMDAGGFNVPGNVYAGLDSMATKIINDNRWVPGKLLYRVAPLRAVVPWRPARFGLVLDGVEHAFTAHMIVLAKSGGYGHGLKIVPSAVVDDGQIHVLVADATIKKVQVGGLMKAAKTGAHVANPGVHVFTAREVTLSCERTMPLCYDGDQFGVLPTTVRVKPGALRVLAPQ